MMMRPEAAVLLSKPFIWPRRFNPDETYSQLIFFPSLKASSEVGIYKRKHENTLSTKKAIKKKRK